MKRIPDANLFKEVEKAPPGVPLSTEQPDVTVVTVVFNAVKSGRAETFRRCLDSVQRQVGCAVEHVIVDGASKDGTFELVRNYANATIPMRVFSAPDAGIYEAMNRGISLARGKYVVFLNSDDYFCKPDGLSASVKALEASGADYSYALAHVVDTDGNEIEHFFSSADESLNLFSGMTICHQTILVRRAVLVAVDGFDLAYRSASDYDLFLRIIYAGYKGVRVEKDFVTFQCGGFSNVNAKLSENEVDAIFRRIIREKFGVDFADRVIRKMRMTQEYPTNITANILAIGERSFQRPLRSASVESPKWDNGMKCRFDHELPNVIWRHYKCTWLSGGSLRQLVHCLAFSCCHPIHAMGAVKAWVLHWKDGYQPLYEWFVVRCFLRAERKFDTYLFAYPYDIAGAVETLRKTPRGLTCTNILRVPVGEIGSGRFSHLLVLLYACAFQEDEQLVEVRLDGKQLGRIRLQPAEIKDSSWSLFRLSKEVVSKVSEVEIRMPGGGEFVFGGLCLCSRL